MALVSVIQKPVRKKAPKVVAVINQNGCTGCEACIQFCPVDYIEIAPGPHFQDFQKLVEVDQSRCIGCQLCSKNCPWDTIPMFGYEEGIQKAPSITIKSICNQKTKADINLSAASLGGGMAQGTNP